MINKANSILMDVDCSNIEFYIGDFLNLSDEIDLSKVKINKLISNYALHHLKLEDKIIALQKAINILGENLETICIGDLMLFDDPEKYISEYNTVGYGPANDFPCYCEELINVFEKNNFTVTIEQIHPLVGVLKAEK